MDTLESSLLVLTMKQTEVLSVGSPHGGRIAVLSVIVPGYNYIAGVFVLLHLVVVVYPDLDGSRPTGTDGHIVPDDGRHVVRVGFYRFIVIVVVQVKVDLILIDSGVQRRVEDHRRRRRVCGRVVLSAAGSDRGCIVVVVVVVSVGSRTSTTPVTPSAAVACVVSVGCRALQWCHGGTVLHRFWTGTFYIEHGVVVVRTDRVFW